jgi:hypothetical protein
MVEPVAVVLLVNLLGAAIMVDVLLFHLLFLLWPAIRAVDCNIHGIHESPTAFSGSPTRRAAHKKL